LAAFSISGTFLLTLLVYIHVYWKTLFSLIAGVICVLVGVAGIFLPIIPGVPILLLGLHLIGVRMPWLDRWTQRLKHWIVQRQTR
jgi:uncharacterized membrane protein YbaN (DUF454 family)